MPLKTIDINADVGESYGNFQVGQDAELMPYLTSCNMACGYHGGDPLTMHRTISLALEHQVAIGAHPSYPDLMGFGRRRMMIPPDELKRLIEYQVFALKGMVEAQGGQLHHVKPHGALNNHMMDNLVILDLIMETIHDIDPKLLIYVPYHPSVRKSENLRFELFADRTYEADLKLTPRSKPGGLIQLEEEMATHLQPILEFGQVQTNAGFKSVEVDTVCIHGDNPGALAIARRLHTMVNTHRIELTSVI